MRKTFVLMLILVMSATGCVTINMPETANTLPVAYIDSIQPAKASIGEVVTFTGHGTDADGTIIGYEWRSSLDGVLSTTASFRTSALSAGTHNIYLRVLDNRNQWSLDKNGTVTISPREAKPVIDSFTASPGSIVRGGAVELRWSVTGAKTVSIDNGIGTVAASGSRLIYPVTGTTYILSASNDGGNSVSTVSITVQDTVSIGNPVITFTAQHLGGTQWQINWNVLNSRQQVIEPDIGPVIAAGSRVVTVPSGQTRKYRLTATNDWGWAYWEVVMVTP